MLSCIMHTSREPTILFLGYMKCMGQVYCMNLWSNQDDIASMLNGDRIVLNCLGLVSENLFGRLVSV